MHFVRIGLLLFLVNSYVFSQFESDLYRFTHLNVTHGLSNNQINSIYKDSRGFMWFGTMSGLNRYDGNSFKIYQNVVTDTTSIDDNFVEKIFEDHKGRIWVTTLGGQNIYNPEKETFTTDIEDELKKISIPGQIITNIISDNSGNFWITGDSTVIYKYNTSQDSTIKINYLTEAVYNSDDAIITSLYANSKNEIWVITTSGTLVLIDAVTHDIIHIDHYLNDYYNGARFSYSLYVDDDDDLWISIVDDAHGVFYYNAQGHRFRHFHKDSGYSRLNNNIVRGVVQDQKGIIWVGTDHGGINLIDKSNFSVSYLLHDPYFSRNLSQNSVTALLKDDTGIIWIGTYKKGINYYHEDIIKFRTYKNILSDRNSLGFDDVNSFVEDNQGNLWIGTNGGGLKYFNRQNNTFTHFTHDESDPASISSDVIVCLHIDRDENLWIGTFHGGLNFYDGDRFYHYKTTPDNPRGISSNHVWKIVEDSKGNLWIATLGGGLNMFDRRRNEFYHYKSGDVNSVNSDFILSIRFDKNENLWLATANGVDVLDKQTGRFIHYTHLKNIPGTLSNNHVNTIIDDSRGNIWIGTRDGLNLYLHETGNFKVFRMEDGLPDNTIHSIVEDKNKNLWIGTLGGLSNLIVTEDDNGNQTFEFKNYDETDGLQGREFNLGSAYCTRNGEVLVGGANGFNIFSPDELKLNARVPDVVITNLQVLNRNISVNEKINGRVLLERSITKTNKIVFKHKENMFSLEFAALSFFHPEKNNYLYMLEGFNNEWISADASLQKATYTNLNPGEYTFRVIASNNDDFWNEEGASLTILVLPPFWKTRVAFVIYILIIVGALWVLRLIITERARLNFKNEQERREAERRHDLDMLKIKFFTNISHEFKTPLTLIINPLDKILKEITNEPYKQQLLLVYRNARRLLNLIRQLLDFRRIEVQEIKLNPVKGDIVKFTSEVCYSFTDLSENKDIKLEFKTNSDEFYTYFDHDKYERTLFNLLSNAFKFTPEHGSVIVSLDTPDLSNERIDNEDVPWITLVVEDTGIGIAVDKQDLIFERFFQNDVPGSMINPGTGIGLSLVSEYVKLHGGLIELQSEQGKGSRFTIKLPYSDNAPKPGADITDTSGLNEMEQFQVENPKKAHQKPPVLLLVEDNEDFRFYLKDNLKGTYTIVEAANGKDGWKVALANMPDLIVSDVMMPIMDGIELAKKIRNDQRTSHIPIILLTARSSEEHKMLGFDTGADEYIAKPFSFEILESRIRNLITQRELLRSSFQNQFDIKPADISVTSLDEKLIDKAIKIVEKNISNPDFSVEEMSKEIGMSRVHLYKKLLSLTGKTPIEFIRILRLKRAAQLLKKSQLSVSEVAYEVGFNNPKYFTKYFKSEFNTLPSQYASEEDQKGDKNNQ